MATLPNYVQLDSPLEFTRLVCALERSPRVSFLHEHNGKKVLSVQMDLLKEKPVIYFTPIENIGHYLCYGKMDHHISVMLVWMKNQQNHS